MDEGNNQNPDDGPLEQEPENRFEPQPRSTADYEKYSPPTTPRAQWQKWLVWLLIVVVIFAMLLVSYDKFKKKPATTKITATTQSTASKNSQTPSVISATTKNLASQNFALSFDYPADWTVTDSGGGVMLVKSPSLTLPGSTNSQSKTLITVKFRNKTQKLTEFDAGDAVATRDSIKIAYTKPTTNQRADTYVSFLRYAKHNSGIDGIYITGNSGYKSGQTIPAADIAKVDPVISINFLSDVGDSNQASAQTPISDATWDNPNVSTPLLNILKSLVIT